MLWNFKQFGTKTALLNDCGESITYNELAERSTEIAKVIDGRCLVFVLCKNTLGSAIAYFSSIEQGIVPALLNANLEQLLLDSLIEQYRPAYIWSQSDISNGKYTPVYECYDYKLFKTDNDKDVVLHDDLALLLTTSGSTGSPKFVRQSYQNISSNMKSIASYLSITGEERPITTLPMNYTYGLSILQSHALVGATMLLTDAPVTTRDFWTFFKTQDATSFGGVPYTYEMLDQMRFTRTALPSLKTMTQAGGKLLPSLHEKLAKWCMETGKQFIVMYGQCEATARMAYLPWEQSLEKVGAMGVAIPGGRFELIDVNGEPIKEPNIAGELRYFGENVTLGYAESCSDLAKGDERNGVLDTGDIAQMDEEGIYTIVGRKKRFLKLFGNRVNLDEVERMLKAEYPEVEVACAGNDDNLIIFSTNEDMLENMRNYIIAKTGLSHQGFSTKKIDSIPKNEAGKVLYRELE